MYIDDRRMTLAVLADTLPSRMDNPVRDMTGIPGAFAIVLDSAVEAPGTADDGAKAERPPTSWRKLPNRRVKTERARLYAIIFSARADVAKLADALDLGSSAREGV